MALRDEDALDPKKHLSREREAIAGTCKGSASEAAHVSSQAESLHRPFLFQHRSPLGQGCQCWEKLEHRFKRNRASLDSTLRDYTPATWDLTPPSIEQ